MILRIKKSIKSRNREGNILKIVRKSYSSKSGYGRVKTINRVLVEKYQEEGKKEWSIDMV